MSTGTSLPETTNTTEPGVGEAGPDLRSWLATLEAADQLRRITASVDWDEEIGAMTRANLSLGGPRCCSRTSSATKTLGARSS